MKAVRIKEHVGPQGLALDSVVDPSPNPSEVLVKVAAFALNRADLLQSMGRYPAPPGVVQDIPGLEYAGEVVACGALVRRYKVGDRVMGLLPGGAFAELIVAHELEALPIPTGMAFSQAAAIPEAFCTAWDALWLQAGLRAGDHALVHAVGSGVGTAAVQLARAFKVHCAGTSRTEDKLKKARGLGLELGVLCKETPTFAEAVRTWSSGKGVEAVLDLVGGDYLPESVAAMSKGATLMVVGLTAGLTAEVPLATVLSQRLRLQGTTMRSRAPHERIALAQRFEKEVLPLFSVPDGSRPQGGLEAVIDSVWTVEQIQPAFARLAGNASFGKIVLSW